MTTVESYGDVARGPRGALGGELRQARRATGMSRTQLADSVDVSPGYVAMLEQGQRRPSGALLARLLAALNSSPADAARLTAGAAVDSLGDALPALSADALTLLDLVVDALLVPASATERSRELLAATLRGFRRPANLEQREMLAGHLLEAVALVLRRWDRSEFLSTREYFRIITSTMRSRHLLQVSAVNTISPRRWLEDPREVEYLEANGEAATHNCVIIRRLFVVGAGLSASELELVARALEHRHVAAADGAGIRWLRQEEVSTLSDQAEDMVLFDFDSDKHPPEMYIGHSDPDDVVRVEFGEKISNPEEIARHRQYFNRMYASAHEDYRALQ